MIAVIVVELTGCSWEHSNSSKSSSNSTVGGGDDDVDGREYGLPGTAGPRVDDSEAGWPTGSRQAKFVENVLQTRAANVLLCRRVVCAVLLVLLPLLLLRPFHFSSLRFVVCTYTSAYMYLYILCLCYSLTLAHFTLALLGLTLHRTEQFSFFIAFRSRLWFSSTVWLTFQNLHWFTPSQDRLWV